MGGGDTLVTTPLPIFSNNVLCVNPSLDSYCTGGGLLLWIMCNFTVDLSTHTRSNASLLDQHLDGHLASMDALWTATKVHLEVISISENSFCVLGVFDFVMLQLFAAPGSALPLYMKTIIQEIEGGSICD